MPTARDKVDQARMTLLATANGETLGADSYLTAAKTLHVLGQLFCNIDLEDDARLLEDLAADLLRPTEQTRVRAFRAVRRLDKAAYHELGDVREGLDEYLVP